MTTAHAPPVTAWGRTLPGRMTTAEFLALDVAEGERWELINGRPTPMAPAPDADHQRAVLGIAARFHLDRGLIPADHEAFVAPFDVVLQDGSVVQPDVVIVPRAAVPSGSARFEGEPTVVIEVRSPSTAARDAGEKLRLYEAAGAREYWLIDPRAPALLLFERADAGFARCEPDADGYVRSEFLGRVVRLARTGDRIEIEFRAYAG
jgi:Uma2 family endonuclease